MASSKEKKTIEAAEKTLRIITALSQEDSLGTTELGRRLNISKSTVHHHLNALYEHGFVTKVEDRYQLSLQFLQFGEQVRDRSSIYNVGHSEVSNLAEETGQPTHLLTEEGGAGVFVKTESGRGGVPSDHRVGERVPLHTIAAGKAILAHLPEQQTTNVIDTHGLPKRTSKTVDTPKALFRELEMVHSQGYATDRGEWSERQWSIAAPILREETVVGAVGISGFADDHEPKANEEELAEEVKTTAEVISIKFHYS